MPGTPAKSRGSVGAAAKGRAEVRKMTRTMLKTVGKIMHEINGLTPERKYRHIGGICERIAIAGKIKDNEAAFAAAKTASGREGSAFTPAVFVYYANRDEHGNERCGSVGFRNPEGIGLKEGYARIAAAEAKRFIASQIRVPERFLWSPASEYDPLDEGSFPEGICPGSFMISPGDSCWHEILLLGRGVARTDGQAPGCEDPEGRTFAGFLAEVEAAAKNGWEAFEPESRRRIACPKCGIANILPEKFCHECGSNLLEEDE